MSRRRKTAGRARTLLITVSLILVVALAQTAYAGNFHFNKINFGLGSSLVLKGDLAGLGNQDAEVTLTGYGTVTAMCQNNGGKKAPGRNPISVQVQQTVQITTDENGKAFVELAAPDPTSPQFEPSPTPKEAGCPSAKWTVVDIVDGSTNWTAANVVVRDQSGAVQLDLWFTCTTFFANGVATGVECVES